MWISLLGNLPALEFSISFPPPSINNNNIIFWSLCRWLFVVVTFQQSIILYSERDWSRITAVTTSRSPQNISLWLLRWCEWLQVVRDRKRWDRIASQLHWTWLAWHGSDFVILSTWALSRIVSTEVRDPQFSLTFRLPSRYRGKPVYIGFPEPNPHGDQFNFLFFSVIAGLVFLIFIYWRPLMITSYPTISSHVV